MTSDSWSTLWDDTIVHDWLPVHDFEIQEWNWSHHRDHHHDCKIDRTLLCCGWASQPEHRSWENQQQQFTWSVFGLHSYINIAETSWIYRYWNIAPILTVSTVHCRPVFSFLGGGIWTNENNENTNKIRNPQFPLFFFKKLLLLLSSFTCYQ